MGTSGVGLWGSDIGGFFELGATALNTELLNRWIAFGGLSVIMRNEKDGIRIPDKARPQLWDAAHLPIWRRYAKLHTQLYPYIRAAVAEYHATGMPVMRHHALTHPDDSQAVARDDQYMFGPDLLIAPVYVAGATTRELYLPQGRWIEWWRAVEYRVTDGDFVLREAPVIEGGRSITVAAPIEQIPIFVRAGARIPLLQHGMHLAVSALVQLRARRVDRRGVPRRSRSNDDHVAHAHGSATPRSRRLTGSTDRRCS